MKKVILITLSLFLILASVYSMCLLKIVNKKNKELQKNVTNIKKDIEYQKIYSGKQEEEITELKKHQSEKLEELSIWQKAEEKLKKATN